MKVILTMYADVAGQHYGPGTRLIVSDEIGNTLIDQGKAHPAKEGGESRSAAPNASEAALALADEFDLDLSEVSGSGKDGAILKSDVQRALESDVPPGGRDGG